MTNTLKKLKKKDLIKIILGNENEIIKLENLIKEKIKENKTLKTNLVKVKKENILRQKEKTINVLLNKSDTKKLKYYNKRIKLCKTDSHKKIYENEIENLYKNYKKK
jgi:hypothetical protein